MDPDGFTIAASGGDITTALLDSLLAANNTTIASTSGSGSDGNIWVNGAVSWAANTTLTLTATNNVNVNSAITATGTSAGLTLNAGQNININAPITLSGSNAAMVMNYGGYNGTTVTTPAAGTNYNILTPASYSGATLNANGIPVPQQDTSGGVYGSVTLSGGSNSLTINGNPYTLIYNLGQVATTGTLSGYYALAENIDATAWSAANTGTPSVIANFSGTLAGLGNTISNLTLNTPSASYVGLIGATPSGTTVVLRDIGLTNVNIIGQNYVGALLGFENNATTPLTVNNIYVTGVVQGAGDVGGLIGRTYRSTISYTYSSANVTASGSNAGGLIGIAVNATTMTNSDSTGQVTAYGYAGGLIGYLGNLLSTAQNINLSYATGNITASFNRLCRWPYRVWIWES